MVLSDGGSAKRSRRFYLKIILFGGTKTMKKVLCTVLAVVMAVACFAGCSAPAAEGGNTAASGDTIKVGLLGPYTENSPFTALP